MAKENQTFYVGIKVLEDFDRKIIKENYLKGLKGNRSSKTNQLLELYIEKGESLYNNKN